MSSVNPYQSPENLAAPPALRPTVWFRRFRRGFLWWGAFPPILAVMLMSTGQNASAFLLLTVVWWLVGLSLAFHSNSRFFTAFALVCALWLLGCHETVRRILFAIENQGFERPEGLGSPAAFLFGLVIEQCFLFIPMSILLGLGIAAIRSRRT